MNFLVIIVQAKHIANECALRKNIALLLILNVLKNYNTFLNPSKLNTHIKYMF